MKDEEVINALLLMADLGIVDVLDYGKYCAAGQFFLNMFTCSSRTGSYSY